MWMDFVSDAAYLASKPDILIDKYNDIGPRSDSGHDNRVHIANVNVDIQTSQIKQLYNALRNLC